MGEEQAWCCLNNGNVRIAAETNCRGDKVKAQFFRM